MQGKIGSAMEETFAAILAGAACLVLIGIGCFIALEITATTRLVRLGLDHVDTPPLGRWWDWFSPLRRAARMHAESGHPERRGVIFWKAEKHQADVAVLAEWKQRRAS